MSNITIIGTKHGNMVRRSRNSKESKLLTSMINRSFMLNGLPDNEEYAELYATIILLELRVNENIDLSFLISNQDRFENRMMQEDNTYGYSTVHKVAHILSPLFSN